MTPRWCDAWPAGAAAAILVTVAQADGSTPREAGARMLVTATDIRDTIGGGHLEFSAIDFARAMLAQSPGGLAGQRRLERFALGPTLGQCCGGVVHLAFERLDAIGAGQLALLRQRLASGEASWRLTPLDDMATPVILDAAGNIIAGAIGASVPALDADRPKTCTLLRDAAGRRWLADCCMPHRAQLLLFGAGHVGAAIVQAFAGLPCRITWVDQRADAFPAALPDNVTVEVTDLPEAVIDAAPAGASYLVMTHSHRLDQALAEQILRRGDAGWFGLIGSRTKRLQFERRLQARGIAPRALATMVCPVGIDGIDGKAPAVIAVAVAAQLLQAWQPAADSIASRPSRKACR